MVDKRDKNVFISRLRRFTMKEKRVVKETTSAPFRLLVRAPVEESGLQVTPIRYRGWYQTSPV